MHFVMFLFLFTVAFASLFSQVSGDFINCSGTHLVDPPQNLSAPWYFPDGWTDAGPITQYAGNQNCSWKFNVPKGLFAFLTITASTDVFSLTMTDSIGNVEWIDTNANRAPYFLLDPGFSVDLMARTPGNLGMRVLWTKVGQFNPVPYQMIPGDVPFVLSSGAFDNGTVISSASRVSLVSLPPPSAFSDLAPYMRNTVVFDGATLNDKFLGNLWQVYDSGNHLVSSGKFLTLYSLMPSLMLNNYILLQDYQNVQGFSTYKGIMCYTTLCPVAIDGRNGSGAAVRMSGSTHYLQTVDVPSTATLEVYTGALKNSDMLRRYSNDQMKNQLPQEFTGLFTTYVLNNGVGAIYLSYDPNSAKWNNAFPGRNGLLVSKNFGVASTDQNIAETISGPSSQRYKITLTLKQAGLMGSASLRVTIKDGKKTAVDSTYSDGPTNPGTIVSYGNSLTVTYQTHGSETTGTQLEFLFENGAGAAGYVVLIMMVLAWTSIC